MFTRGVTPAPRSSSETTFVTGDSLRLARLVRRIRQDEIAGEMRVSRPMISKIEGQMRPSTEHIEAYLEAIATVVRRLQQPDPTVSETDNQRSGESVRETDVVRRADRSPVAGTRPQFGRTSRGAA
jgi:transcriptional regulator with XRE-family HTH domain